MKFLSEIPIQHCQTCGTFSENQTMMYKVPEGANMTRIIISIEEEFEVTKSFIAYTPLALFAELGAYLGMFLGWSLVSLSDTFSWILSKLGSFILNTVYKSKIKSFLE